MLIWALKVFIIVTVKKFPFFKMDFNDFLSRSKDNLRNIGRNWQRKIASASQKQSRPWPIFQAKSLVNTITEYKAISEYFYDEICKFE